MWQRRLMVPCVRRFACTLRRVILPLSSALVKPLLARCAHFCTVSSHQHLSSLFFQHNTEIVQTTLTLVKGAASHKNRVVNQWRWSWEKYFSSSYQTMWRCFLIKSKKIFKFCKDLNINLIREKGCVWTQIYLLFQLRLRHSEVKCSRKSMRNSCLSA